jgi:Ni,Fe-hydrogenase I small subunit
MLHTHRPLPLYTGRLGIRRELRRGEAQSVDFVGRTGDTLAAIAILAYDVGCRKPGSTRPCTFSATKRNPKPSAVNRSP